MKVFTFILSFYIVALSIVPCADGLDHDSDNSVSELSLKQEHDHSEDDQDDCTPFCTCVCCGSLLAMPTTHQGDKSSQDLSSSYLFHYTSDYSFIYSEGVWHPPSKG